MDDRLEPGLEEFDLDAALAEAEQHLDDEPVDGAPRLADDVILDLAHRALEGYDKVRLATSGLNSMLGLGRKGEGLKVSIDDDGPEPSVTLDVYLLLRYGLRIPDTAWDLQERLKNALENVTGLRIKAVNIHVLGLFFPDNEDDSES